MTSACVLRTKGLPVLNTLPNSDPSTGCSESSVENPLLSGKSRASWRNWRRSGHGSYTPTESQCMSCRMLAEIARRRSRSSKFETRVFVTSRSSFSRSFSCSSSACMLFDSCVVSALTGDFEELIFSTTFRNPGGPYIWRMARAPEPRLTCLSEVWANVGFRVGSADTSPGCQPLSALILLRLQLFAENPGSSASLARRMRCNKPQGDRT